MYFIRHYLVLKYIDVLKLISNRSHLQNYCFRKRNNLLSMTQSPPHTHTHPVMFYSCKLQIYLNLIFFRHEHEWIFFVADTTNPVITFDKPDPEKPQKDLSVSWKSSEEADFECSLDDPTLYEPCGKGKTGLFQKDDLPDGEHRFYVRGKDNVGNVGDPSVYTVVTGRDVC